MLKPHLPGRVVRLAIVSVGHVESVFISETDVYLPYVPRCLLHRFKLSVDGDDGDAFREAVRGEKSGFSRVTERKEKEEGRLVFT